MSARPSSLWIILETFVFLVLVLVTVGRTQEDVHSCISRANLTGLCGRAQSASHLLPGADRLALCGVNLTQPNNVTTLPVSFFENCVAHDAAGQEHWGCNPIATDTVGHLETVGWLDPAPTFTALDIWERQLSRTGGLRLPPSALWALSPPQLAWLGVQTAAADVALTAASDPHLAWADLDEGLRSWAVHEGGVIGVPYDVDPLLLFYRRDALSAAELDVPETWEELIAAAEALNATQRECGRAAEAVAAEAVTAAQVDTGAAAAAGYDGAAGCYGRGFCLLLPPGCSNDGALLAAVWASMAAVAGPEAGLYFNATSMSPRFGGPAMTEAVAVFRELVRLGGSPGGPPCSRLDWAAARSSCALGIAGSSAVRLLGLSPSKTATGGNASSRGDGAGGRWRGWGQTGSAPLPGSTRVEDPAGGGMADCDPDLCPFAQPHPRPSARTGSSSGNSSSGGGGGNNSGGGLGDGARLVNRAPHPGRGPFFLALSKSPASGPAGQLAAWRALTAALTPEASWARVTDPRVFASPVRTGQLSLAALPAWEAAGWSRADAADFLTALRYGMGHPNAVPPLRFLGGELVSELLGGAAEAAVAQAGIKPADVAQALLANVTAAFPDGYLLIQKSYLQCIGARGKARLLARGSGTTGGTDSSGDRGLALRDRMGIALGVLAVVVVLVASALFRRHSLILGGQGSRRRRRRGRAVAPIPGYGSQTTLVVTDIQDSTQLWEALPPIVMDLSLNIHNHCVRQLVRRYQGYETHTEGDSFTLAFHTAVEAASFALELQTALMDSDWPAMLLEHPSAAEVFLTTRAAAAAAAAAAVAALSTPPLSIPNSPRTTPPSQRLLFTNTGPISGELYAGGGASCGASGKQLAVGGGGGAAAAPWQLHSLSHGSLPVANHGASRSVMVQHLRGPNANAGGGINAGFGDPAARHISSSASSSAAPSQMRRERLLPGGLAPRGSYSLGEPAMAEMMARLGDGGAAAAGADAAGGVEGGGGSSLKRVWPAWTTWKGSPVAGGLGMRKPPSRRRLGMGLGGGGIGSGSFLTADGTGDSGGSSGSGVDRVRSAGMSSILPTVAAGAVAATRGLVAGPTAFPVGMSSLPAPWRAASSSQRGRASPPQFSLYARAASASTLLRGANAPSSQESSQPAPLTPLMRPVGVMSQRRRSALALPYSMRRPASLTTSSSSDWFSAGGAGSEGALLPRGNSLLLPVGRSMSRFALGAYGTGGVAASVMAAASLPRTWGLQQRLQLPQRASLRIGDAGTAEEALPGGADSADEGPPRGGSRSSVTAAAASAAAAAAAAAGNGACSAESKSRTRSRSTDGDRGGGGGARVRSRDGEGRCRSRAGSRPGDRDGGGSGGRATLNSDGGGGSRAGSKCGDGEVSRVLTLGGSSGGSRIRWQRGDSSSGRARGAGTLNGDGGGGGAASSGSSRTRSRPGAADGDVDGGLAAELRLQRGSAASWEDELLRTAPAPASLHSHGDCATAPPDGNEENALRKPATGAGVGRGRGRRRHLQRSGELLGTSKEMPAGSVPCSSAASTTAGEEDGGRLSISLAIPDLTSRFLTRSGSSSPVLPLDTPAGGQAGGQEGMLSYVPCNTASAAELEATAVGLSGGAVAAVAAGRTTGGMAAAIALGATIVNVTAGGAGGGSAADALAFLPSVPLRGSPLPSARAAAQPEADAPAAALRKVSPTVRGSSFYQARRTSSPGGPSLVSPLRGAQPASQALLDAAKSFPLDLSSPLRLLSPALMPRERSTSDQASDGASLRQALAGRGGGGAIAATLSYPSRPALEAAEEDERRTGGSAPLRVLSPMSLPLPSPHAGAANGFMQFATGSGGATGGPASPTNRRRRGSRNSHSGTVSGSLRNLSRRLSDSLSYARLALTGGASGGSGGIALAAVHPVPLSAPAPPLSLPPLLTHGSVTTGASHLQGGDFPGIREGEEEEGFEGEFDAVGISGALFPPVISQHSGRGRVAAGAAATEGAAAGIGSGRGPVSGKAPDRSSSQRPSKRGFFKGHNKVARSFATALLYETLRAASSNALGSGTAVAHQSEHMWSPAFQQQYQQQQQQEQEQQQQQQRQQRQQQRQLLEQQHQEQQQQQQQQQQQGGGGFWASRPSGLFASLVAAASGSFASGQPSAPRNPTRVGFGALTGATPEPSFTASTFGAAPPDTSFRHISSVDGLGGRAPSVYGNGSVNAAGEGSASWLRADGAGGGAGGMSRSMLLAPKSSRGSLNSDPNALRFLSQPPPSWPHRHAGAATASAAAALRSVGANTTYGNTDSVQAPGSVQAPSSVQAPGSVGSGGSPHLDRDRNRDGSFSALQHQMLLLHHHHHHLPGLQGHLHPQSEMQQQLGQLQLASSPMSSAAHTPWLYGGGSKRPDAGQDAAYPAPNTGLHPLQEVSGFGNPSPDSPLLLQQQGGGAATSMAVVARSRSRGGGSFVAASALSAPLRVGRRASEALVRLAATSRRRLASQSSGRGGAGSRSGGEHQGGGGGGPQVLLFRGFRVRVGIHSGMDEGCDVFWTKRSGRRAYSGPAMRLARLLSDAALGGMVVMSGAALELLRPLPNEQLPAGAMVWHAGRFRLGDKDGTANLDVFQALVPALLPRLQAFRGVPLRVVAALMPGLMDAPVGPVALVTCQVVGVEALRSWNLEVAEEALEMFRWQAAEVVAEHGGTMVELEGGAAVAAFTGAYPAVTSLLTLEDDMKTVVPWPAALLEHELGEEICCVLPPGPDGVVVTQLVHCGPRVRCAAEWFGDVRLDLGVTRAVQLYRNASSGKPWKNLQRMLRYAKMGQTLISVSLQRLLLCSGGPLLSHIQVEPLLPAAANAYGATTAATAIAVGAVTATTAAASTIATAAMGSAWPAPLTAPVSNRKREKAAATHDGFISSSQPCVQQQQQQRTGARLLRQRSAEYGPLVTAMMSGFKPSRGGTGVSSGAAAGDSGGGGALWRLRDDARLGPMDPGLAPAAEPRGLDSDGGGQWGWSGGGRYCDPGVSGPEAGIVAAAPLSQLTTREEPEDWSQTPAQLRLSKPLSSALYGTSDPHVAAAAVTAPAAAMAAAAASTSAVTAATAAVLLRRRDRQSPVAAAAAAIFGGTSGTASGHGGTSTSAAISASPSDGSDLDHWPFKARGGAGQQGQQSSEAPQVGTRSGNAGAVGVSRSRLAMKATIPPANLLLVPEAASEPNGGGTAGSATEAAALAHVFPGGDAGRAAASSRSPTAAHVPSSTSLGASEDRTAACVNRGGHNAVLATAALMFGPAASANHPDGGGEASSGLLLAPDGDMELSPRVSCTTDPRVSTGTAPASLPLSQRASTGEVSSRMGSVLLLPGRLVMTTGGEALAAVAGVSAFSSSAAAPLVGSASSDAANPNTFPHYHHQSLSTRQMASSAMSYEKAVRKSEVGHGGGAAAAGLAAGPARLAGADCGGGAATVADGSGAREWGGGGGGGYGKGGSGLLSSRCISPSPASGAQTDSSVGLQSKAFAHQHHQQDQQPYPGGMPYSDISIGRTVSGHILSVAPHLSHQMTPANETARALSGLGHVAAPPPPLGPPLGPVSPSTATAALPWAAASPSPAPSHEPFRSTLQLRAQPSWFQRRSTVAVGAQGLATDTAAAAAVAAAALPEQRSEPLVTLPCMQAQIPGPPAQPPLPRQPAAVAAAVAASADPPLDDGVSPQWLCSYHHDGSTTSPYRFQSPQRRAAAACADGGDPGVGASGAQPAGRRYGSARQLPPSVPAPYQTSLPPGGGAAGELASSGVAASAAPSPCAPREREIGSRFGPHLEITPVSHGSAPPSPVQTPGGVLSYNQTRTTTRAPSLPYSMAPSPAGVGRGGGTMQPQQQQEGRLQQRQQQQQQGCLSSSPPGWSASAGLAGQGSPLRPAQGAVAAAAASGGAAHGLAAAANAGRAPYNGGGAASEPESADPRDSDAGLVRAVDARREDGGGGCGGGGAGGGGQVLWRRAPAAVRQRRLGPGRSAMVGGNYSLPPPPWLSGPDDTTTFTLPYNDGGADDGPVVTATASAAGHARADERPSDRTSRATLWGLLPHGSETTGSNIAAAGGGGGAVSRVPRLSISNRLLSPELGLGGDRERGAVFVCRWKWVLGPGKDEVPYA